MNKVQYRSDESAKFATECNLQKYIICPTPGCVRQCSSEARMEQHISKGKHQSNGNATSQSTKIIEPSELDGQSIHQMSINSLLATVMETFQNAGGIEESVLGANIALQEVEFVNIPERFGWAIRRTLKHPRYALEALKFFTWIFEQGDKKGGSKCSASTMISFAREYGTDVKLFEKEAF